MEALYKLRICLRTLRAFLRTECLRLCGAARFRRSGASACSPRPHAGERFLGRARDCDLRVDLFSTVTLGSVRDPCGRMTSRCVWMACRSGWPQSMTSPRDVPHRCIGLQPRRQTTKDNAPGEPANLSLPAPPTGTVGLRCQGPGSRPARPRPAERAPGLHPPREVRAPSMRRTGRIEASAPVGRVEDAVRLPFPDLYTEMAARPASRRSWPCAARLDAGASCGVRAQGEYPASGAHGLQIEVHRPSIHLFDAATCHGSPRLRTF